MEPPRHGRRLKTVGKFLPRGKAFVTFPKLMPSVISNRISNFRGFVALPLHLLGSLGRAACQVGSGFLSDGTQEEEASGQGRPRICVDG